MTEIVPPGQPPHRFDYTPLDQEHEYTPPDLGDGDPATRYRYNRDKQLTRIIRPDLQTVEMSYTSGGQLDVLHLPMTTAMLTTSRRDSSARSPAPMGEA